MRVLSDGIEGARKFSSKIEFVENLIRRKFNSSKTCSVEKTFGKSQFSTKKFFDQDDYIFGFSTKSFYKKYRCRLFLPRESRRNPL